MVAPGAPEAPAMLVSLPARRDRPVSSGAVVIPSVAALYGFSGGGYNVRWVLQSLTPVERKRIHLVVVLGAPLNNPSLYRGMWELVYRLDPPQGHMAGPRALLDSAR